MNIDHVLLLSVEFFKRYFTISCILLFGFAHMEKKREKTSVDFPFNRQLACEEVQGRNAGCFAKFED
jgi:hypothetical protein